MVHVSRIHCTIEGTPGGNELPLTLSPRKPNLASATTCLCLEESSRLASGSEPPKPGVPSTVHGITGIFVPQSSLWFCSSKLWSQVSQHRAACVSQKHADARRPDRSHPSLMMLAPLSILYNTDPTHRLLLSHMPRLPYSQKWWQRAGQSGRPRYLSQLP